MPSIYRPSSPLSQAFDELQLELVALDRAWTDERERSGLRHAAVDIRHHVCAALTALDDREDEAPGTPAFTRLDQGARILAHEAFLAVLALGQLLRRALDDGLAPPAAIAACQLVVDQLLDELAPCVSGADRAMRRVLLDDEPLETALAGLGHGR